MSVCLHERRTSAFETVQSQVEENRKMLLKNLLKTVFYRQRQLHLKPGSQREGQWQENSMNSDVA